MLRFILFLLFIGFTFIQASIPWKYDGFDRFPVFFFGASPQGLESVSTMQLISNHSIGGWGFQQNNTNIIGEEERNLYNQAEAFYDYFHNKSSNSFNHTRSTFIYRDAMSAGSFWNSTKNIINDTAYSSFWIKNDKNQVCWATNWEDVQDGDPIWDFRNKSAFNYYLDNVIDELISNKPYINSVFFDEFDWITCSFNFSTRTNCTEFTFTDKDKYDIGKASIELFAKASEILNSHGIVPVLSVSTVMNKYMNLTKCVIAEEDIINGLSNVSWMRYYESYPDSWPGHVDNMFFLSRIEEMKYNVPVQIHPYGVNPNKTIDPYYIATFLMTQQEYSYFGGSNGWYDDNWSWHNAYNVKYGKPLMDPMQLNSTAWFRSFEYCNITLDTQSRKASFNFL